MEARAARGLPPYVSMPSVTRSGGPNFLGGTTRPRSSSMVPHNSTGFRVRDVVLPAESSEARRNPPRTAGRPRRNEALQRPPDRKIRRRLTNISSRAWTWCCRPRPRRPSVWPAREEKVRDAYGRNDFAQRLLMARRLVEVGVSQESDELRWVGSSPKLFDAYKGTM